MSKLFIDFYYFVKSSSLKIEIVNDDISYIHLIPSGANREVQVPAGNEGHTEASNYIPFGCKFFCGYCKYLFRSKAQLMSRN